jgi:hypothetical protein
VYPYIIPESPIFGWELKYSIRSLYKYYQEPFDITIIGEIPSWINSTEIRCISYDNSSEKSIANRLYEKYLMAAEIYNEFIVIHDDMFLMNPVNEKDIQKLYYLHELCPQDYLQKNLFKEKNGFQRALINSLQKLHMLGKPQYYNFILHKPFPIQSEKLINLHHLIGTDDIGHAFEQLYYGYYLQEDTVVEKISEKIKYGIYDEKRIFIPEETKFLNISENGYLCHLNLKILFETFFHEKSLAEEL